MNLSLRYLLFVLIFNEGNLLGQDRSLMKNLQKRYVHTINLADNKSAHIVAQSFDVLARYHNQARVKDLLESPLVEQLFTESLYRSVDQQVSDSVRSAQYVMLLHLYSTMFHQYIKTAQSFLNSLISAKRYWFYEDFYMSQAVYRRHPVYSLYSSSYKKIVHSRLALLEDLEAQIAHMLGMCLYGTHKIEQIEREDQIVEYLLEAINPLYTTYHAPYPVKDIQNDPMQLFHDLSWMYGTMAQHMDYVKIVLEENDKPSFAREHWFGLSCAAITALAAYVVYKQHEQDIPRIQKKTVSSVKYVWNDYVVESVQGLIDILWYDQGKKIKHVELLDDLPESHDFRLYLINHLWNKLVYVLNQWKNSAILTANKKIDEGNDLFMKNQQVNLYLAAIGPVLLGAYVALKCTKTGYNRFIQHDNWYAPMKYDLRIADQLINAVARSNKHSFANDGKLYMLIMHMRQYISCLDNEELILMHADLDDLQSFDLTYEQKHGVIERMYRTYQFLK